MDTEDNKIEWTAKMERIGDGGAVVKSMAMAMAMALYMAMLYNINIDTNWLQCVQKYMHAHHKLNGIKHS